MAGVFPLSVGIFFQFLKNGIIHLYRHETNLPWAVHVDHCKALPATSDGVFTDITIKQAPRFLHDRREFPSATHEKDMKEFFVGLISRKKSRSVDSNPGRLDGVSLVVL